MQQFAPAKPPRRGLGLVAIAVPVAAAGLLFGCGGPADDARPKAADKPFAGAALTVGCPDARLAAVLGPMARAWAARTGATVEVLPPAAADRAAVGVVPFADLGGPAARGELLPVPAALKEPAHPYQWSGVLAAYRGEPFAGWGSQVFGLPLAGDGAVLVYRADLFARAKRAAPATWEDLADAAAFFAARDKKPSLPPLPTDPARLVALVSRVAACYDRPARGDATDGGADTLAFQFRLDDARPRLDAPAFARAAGWLADLKTRGCVGDGPPDPVAALVENRAVAAVLTFDELARLKVGSKMDARYAAAPLPGTRGYADPKSGQLVAGGGANFVPHFAGGWLGVVRKSCDAPDAAFDLLADLGGPVRSAELIAATGYGPFRDAHLDRDRPVVWLGYGFDPDGTKTLVDAARGFVGKAVRNPTYGLRGPDHAALTVALADELKTIAAGEVAPAAGLARVVEAWEKAGVGTPADTLKEWRRRAVGLN